MSYDRPANAGAFSASAAKTSLRLEVVRLLAQRAEEIGEDEPARAGESRRRLRLLEALHTPAQVGQRSLLFHHVGDGENDVGLRKVCWHRRREHDDNARLGKRAGIGFGELRVGDDERVALLHEVERRVVSGEAEQLGTGPVGGAIGAERQVRDAGERRGLALRHAERPSAIGALDDAREEVQRFVGQVG